MMNPLHLSSFRSLYLLQKNFFHIQTKVLFCHVQLIFLNKVVYSRMDVRVKDEAREWISEVLAEGHVGPLD